MTIREYCYTGDISHVDTGLMGEIAVDLLAAANEYSLPRLKGQLESILGYSVDSDNAACLYDLAVLYNAEVLERACLVYMIQHHKQVGTSEAWKTMNRENKKTVIAKAKTWKSESKGEGRQ